MLNQTACYVVSVMFLATLIRSTLGFGEALVAVPLLALRLPVVVAAPLAVVASVLVAGVIVVQDHRKVDVRSAAGLIVSAMFGIPLGLFVLVYVNDRVVKAALGSIIIAFSVYSLLARPAARPGRGGRAWMLACGFCSGVLGGAYGMNGPPLAIYGSLRRWSPQQFRATLQGYFFAASLAGLAGYLVMGIWQPRVTRYCLLSLPGILAAVVIGRALNRRLPPNHFFRFVYLGLLVIGGILLSQALRT